MLNKPFVPQTRTQSLFMCFCGRTSLELHCNGKNRFYHNLMKISEYYDLPDFDPNSLSEAKIKHYVDIDTPNALFA